MAPRGLSRIAAPNEWSAFGTSQRCGEIQACRNGSRRRGVKISRAPKAKDVSPVIRLRDGIGARNGPRGLTPPRRCEEVQIDRRALLHCRGVHTLCTELQAANDVCHYVHAHPM